ncbi:MAG: type secretion system-associated domain protein TagH [Pseudomonadota bacterium]|jgi:type VI secretion system FHA domain protein
MIVLSVLSYNGAPTDVAAASFDELGGNIGRADSNHLVLPDPERTISRVHAKVLFRADGYYIVDNGSNPISVNGTPLGAGREHLLASGDKVQIGGYLLEATQQAAGASAPAGAQVGDFSDLFGDIGAGLAAPPATPQPRPSVLHTWAPDPAARRNNSQAVLAPGHIPEDWDPWGDSGPPLGVAAPAPGPAASPSITGANAAGLGDFAPASTESIDDLFGLSAAPSGGDHLGADLARQLDLKPNMSGHDDPLLALARPAKLGPDVFADLGSELNTPMPLPRVLSAQPSAPPPVAAGPVSLPAGAVFSWDAPAAAPAGGRLASGSPEVTRIVPSAAAKAQSRPVVAAPVAAAARPVPAASQPVQHGSFANSSVAPFPMSAAAGGAAVRPQGDPADEATLLAALLEGLGSPGLQVDRLTPAMMLLVGQFLREATRGTIALLADRAAIKRGMRADVTVIVARENNPLKFSATAEVALRHMLGPPEPGYMPTVPAVRAAFDDLRAHQLGVMAGMKAALEGVLQRFDPVVLEGKLTRKSGLGNLLPGSRKARLWELFQELYGQISTEAEDDFNELFGREFLRAYESQLEGLAQQRDRNNKG